MIWRHATGTLSLDRPRVVGIVNVTPDSFSDGGMLRTVDDARRHVDRLVHEGADVVDILRKGRHPLTALHVTFTGARAEEPPRRFTEISLRFDIEGAVPTEAVERAIALSREKYCSVLHSFRQDIAFSTTFQIRA